MRVLLVDDDSRTAQRIEALLQSDGNAVHVTDLGEEAMEFLRRYQYDVVLLSIGLPDMDGYDVLKGARMEGVDTPILVVSSEIDVDKCMRLGADGCLNKPFEPDHLIKMVRTFA
jgi:two-component system, cell cycle response regulator CtrA